MGAVPVGVVGVGDSGVGARDGGVDAVDVVDVAVGIVVDGDGSGVSLDGVNPEVAVDVLVLEEHAGVHHADDHIGCLAADIPSGEGLDVGAGGAAGLAGVVERPLVGDEAGVVGHDMLRADVVGLDVVVEARGEQAIGDGLNVLLAVGFQVADTAQPRMGADEAEACRRLRPLHGSEISAGFGEQGAGAKSAVALLRGEVIGVGRPETW